MSATTTKIDKSINSLPTYQFIGHLNKYLPVTHQIKPVFFEQNVIY